MELQRGCCFFCRNTKVISPYLAANGYKIIGSLFSTNVLNVEEFKKRQSSIRLCPICYHKLIILECTSHNLETNKIHEEEESYDKCCLCKTGKHLFQADNWPRSKEIFEDIPYESKKSVTCSRCFFYLEIQNEVKKKLLTKYPLLKIKPETRERTKRVLSKFQSHNVIHSTPINENRKSMLRKREVIEISSDSDDEKGELKKSRINFDSLKKFKPLKSNKMLRDNRVVKDDSKLLNQIVYVLLDITDFSKIVNKSSIDHGDILIKEIRRAQSSDNSGSEKTEVVQLNVKKRPSFKMRIRKRKQNRKSEIKIKPSNFTVKSRSKINLMKKLVVTLPKIVLEEQNLKLLNSVHLEELSPGSGCSEIVTKRECVSFAEDKNDYYQNGLKSNYEQNISDRENRNHLERTKDSSSSSQSSSDLEDESKSIGLKKRKVSETRSDSEDEDSMEKQKRNRRRKSVLLTRKNKSKKEDTKQVLKEKQFSDQSSSELETGIEIVNSKRRKISIAENVSDADVEDTVEQDKNNIEDAVDRKFKKEKPKPLSKKKKPNMEADKSFNVDNSELEDETKNYKRKKTQKENTENISESDAEDTVEQDRNKVNSEGITDISRKEKPNPLFRNTTEEIVSESDAESSREQDKNETESVYIKGKSKEEKLRSLSEGGSIKDSSESEGETEDFKRKNTSKTVIVSESDADRRDDQGKNKADVRIKGKFRKEKPKPLSKKKQFNVEPDRSSSKLSSESKGETSKTKIVSKSDADTAEVRTKGEFKREKPKPLSKKKQFNVKPDRNFSKFSSEPEGETSKSEIVSESDVYTADEGTNKAEVGIKGKCKRDKPKPLSKMKQFNVEPGRSASNLGSESESEIENVDSQTRKVSQADIVSDSDAEDGKGQDEKESEKIISIKGKSKKDKLPSSKNLSNISNKSNSDLEDESEDTNFEKGTSQIETDFKEKKLSDGHDTKKDDNSLGNEEGINKEADVGTDDLDSRDINISPDTEDQNECSLNRSGTDLDMDDTDDDQNSNENTFKSRIEVLENIEGEENCNFSQNSLRNDKSRFNEENPKIREEDNFDKTKNRKKVFRNEPGPSENEEVLQLVNKYLNNEHKLESTKTPVDQIEKTNIDNTNTRVDQSLDDKNKESGEQNIKKDEAVVEDIKKVDNSNSSSSGEKNEELGLAEEDEDNIAAMLSQMFHPPECSEDMPLNEKDQGNDSSDGNLNNSNKRKLTSDELNTSMEKKKKRVTFCDDVP